MKPRGLSERLALIVLATGAMYLGSCPGAWAGQPSPAAESLVRSSLRLMGRYSAAHACPISPTLALTSAHVLDPRPFDPSVSLSFYTWSDGTGASGFAVPLSTEKARDLGRIEPFGDAVFAHYLPVAQTPPKAGERLYFLGYDFSNKKSAMGDDVIEVRVTRIVALHVMFIPSGRPGSSGSCLVNEAGEVVAINEGGFDTDDGEAGMSVGVWGALAKMPVEQSPDPPFPQPRPLTDGPPKEQR